MIGFTVDDIVIEDDGQFLGKPVVLGTVVVSSPSLSHMIGQVWAALDVSGTLRVGDVCNAHWGKMDGTNLWWGVPAMNHRRRCCANNPACSADSVRVLPAKGRIRQIGRGVV